MPELRLILLLIVYGLPHGLPPPMLAWTSGSASGLICSGYGDIVQEGRILAAIIESKLGFQSLQLDD
jgi:hypothetical protein